MHKKTAEDSLSVHRLEGSRHTSRTCYLCGGCPSCCGRVFPNCCGSGFLPSCCGGRLWPSCCGGRLWPSCCGGRLWPSCCGGRLWPSCCGGRLWPSFFGHWPRFWFRTSTTIVISSLYRKHGALISGGLAGQGSGVGEIYLYIHHRQQSQ